MLLRLDLTSSSHIFIITLTIILRGVIMQAVYKIQNLVNNKVYIGSSVDVEGRFKAHKKSLIDNTHPKSWFVASYCSI